MSAYSSSSSCTSTSGDTASTISSSAFAMDYGGGCGAAAEGKDTGGYSSVMTMKNEDGGTREYASDGEVDNSGSSRGATRTMLRLEKEMMMITKSTTATTTTTTMTRRRRRRRRRYSHGDSDGVVVGGGGLELISARGPLLNRSASVAADFDEDNHRRDRDPRNDDDHCTGGAGNKKKSRSSGGAGERRRRSGARGGDAVDRKRKKRNHRVAEIERLRRGLSLIIQSTKEDAGATRQIARDLLSSLERENDDDDDDDAVVLLEGVDCEMQQGVTLENNEDRKNAPREDIDREDTDRERGVVAAAKRRIWDALLCGVSCAGEDNNKERSFDAGPAPGLFNDDLADNLAFAAVTAGVVFTSGMVILSAVGPLTGLGTRAYAWAAAMVASSPLLRK